MRTAPGLERGARQERRPGRRAARAAPCAAGALTAARIKAGVSDDVHFHDLRHTGNTLASSAGASTRELMTRMGHSTTRAALIYQHMTSDRDQHIAGKLGEMIRQARGEGDPPPSGT
ncbi:tyrosine-type recombinase/integrase [Streptomyces zaomyceticus]|uniref:tyrosine-type recombinase/integrase n=1 Tax=Streptomyces zaomyceticus TaxID=68286 RepID=UPI00352E818E